jgi:hypothetical protein
LKTKISKILSLTSSYGILIFVILYLFSASLYPGGSQANINSEGFDWINNYWCNLTNIKSINGHNNPARPYAISAMVILCLSLLIFFLQFSKVVAKSQTWKIIIKIAGPVSMVLGIFIFTEHHDLLTILSSIFGLLAVIGIIFEIFKSEMNRYKLTGLACILLLGLNNYIYYSGDLIELLPLIQKITFLMVLSWIIGLNFKILNNLNNTHE